MSDIQNQADCITITVPKEQLDEWHGILIGVIKSHYSERLTALAEFRKCGLVEMKECFEQAIKDEEADDEPTPEEIRKAQEEKDNDDAERRRYWREQI